MTTNGSTTGEIREKFGKMLATVLQHARATRRMRNVRLPIAVNA